MEERSERCSGEKCKGKGKGTVDNKNKCPARTYSLFFLIFSVSFLFSKRPSFHHRFILLPSLFPYLSLFHCLPSSFFHDYCLLFASPSVSISFTPEPPGVFCSLLILSDYTRQTLYKRWALFWTWPCTASFHTLQTPLSLHKSFKQPSGRVRKGPPRVKERCERRTLSPHC